MVLKIKTEEDRINEDFLWLGRNMPSLQKDYEERQIAVVDKSVVGFGEDAKEAYSKAKQNKNFQIKSHYQISYQKRD